MLVFAGAVLDMLHGPVARRFRTSGMGDRLDGMCDTVTFGVAPAVALAASGSADSSVARGQRPMTRCNGGRSASAAGMSGAPECVTWAGCVLDFD